MFKKGGRLDEYSLNGKTFAAICVCDCAGVGWYWYGWLVRMWLSARPLFLSLLLVLELCWLDIPECYRWRKEIGYVKSIRLV